MKLNKRNLLVGVGCIVLVAGLYAATKLVRKHLAVQPRGGADGYLQIDNLKRAYNLHVPVSYTAKQPIPVVLAFHPVNGTGEDMQKITGFDSIADKQGFIVVYPDAIAGHWNARRTDKPDTANDIGFVSALIEDLGQRYNIDRNRIYATGLSNGATFTHRVGCELSDKVSAIAVVAGTMPELLARTCKTTKPLSVLIMHGTDDPAISYSESAKLLLSVPQTFKDWSTRNNCTGKVIKQSLPNTSKVEVNTQQCAEDTRIKMYTIVGGEHSWPGSSPAPSSMDGESSTEISASTIIWDFFKHDSKLTAKSNK